MDPITLRFFERIFIALIAGFCLFLSYRLLTAPQSSDQSGKITLPGGLTIDMERVAPGIFLAAIGSLVLVVLAVSALREDENGNVRYYYRGAQDYNDDSLRIALQTLNSIDKVLAQVELYIKEPGGQDAFNSILSDEGRAELKEIVAHRGELSNIKRYLIAPFFTPEELAIWDAYGAGFERARLPPESTQRLRIIESLVAQGLNDDVQ